MRRIAGFMAKRKDLSAIFLESCGKRADMVR